VGWVLPPGKATDRRVDKLMVDNLIYLVIRLLHNRLTAAGSHPCLGIVVQDGSLKMMSSLSCLWIALLDGSLTMVGSLLVLGHLS
jgi:hypothetical protein